ncbi:hypothetical protein IJF86_00495 [Candidatus Saccharibacteria bacterium]|nr:hypothetical protein [Candidatus Saccharibacteria bacterium]
MQKKYGTSYIEGSWSIELRERNNHPGQKVWGLYCGREVFSLDERGLRRRDHGRNVIPFAVQEAAQRKWEEINEG